MSPVSFSQRDSSRGAVWQQEDTQDQPFDTENLILCIDFRPRVNQGFPILRIPGALGK